ncbi:MAG: hypothetical protein ACPG7F_00765 [Aggregatilineales bacterium]
MRSIVEIIKDAFVASLAEKLLASATPQNLQWFIGGAIVMEIIHMVEWV